MISMSLYLCFSFRWYRCCEIQWICNSWPSLPTTRLWRCSIFFFWLLPNKILHNLSIFIGDKWRQMY